MPFDADGSVAMTDTPSNRLIAVVLAVLAIGGVAVAGVAVADQHTTGNADDADAQQSSYLRVVHAAAGAPAVDVAVDNETVLTDFEYSNVTDYLHLPAGNHSVTVTATNDSEQVFFDGEVYLEARTAATLAATTGVTEGGMVEAEPGATPEGDATETSGTNETETPTDDATETPGTNETGTPTDDTTETPTDGAAAPPEDDATAQLQPVMFVDNAWEPDDESAALSAIHLAPDAPAVDVTVPVDDNETTATAAETETPETETMDGNATDGNESGLLVLADDLSYRSASDYVTVPAGEHTLQIREEAPDDDGEVITTVNVTVEGGAAYSGMVFANATQMDDWTTNQTETPETGTPGTNETETPETETTMGNETDDANATGAPVMVNLSEDVTYTINLPGADDEGTDTPAEATETPDEEAETPTEEETDTPTEEATT